jgi:hypothetical protein
MVMRFTKKDAPVLADVPPGPLMLALREKAVPNLIWRFYMDEGHKWKWQHLSVQGEVISQSARSCKDYESCLANAKENGHVFEHSQANTRSVKTAPYYPK